MALTADSSSTSGAPAFGGVSMIPVVRWEGGRTVISLRGEADISTRDAVEDVLRSQVRAVGGGDVIIDLAETTFIDTAIVRSLTTGQRLLNHQGRTLTFRSPSRLATRLPQAFQLTDLIETETTIELGTSATEGVRGPWTPALREPLVFATGLDAWEEKRANRA